MLKILQIHRQLIIGLLFTLYFLYTFSNAMDISQDVVIAVCLTIVLYFQSLGELFYFYKKYGKPRLQDYFRLAIFLIIVLNFMKLINEAEGDPKVSVITKIVSLNDASLTLVITIITFVSLDIAYLLMQSFKKRTISHTFYEIKRKNFVFSLLIFSTVSKFYLLASGLTGFGTDVHDSSGLLSLILTLSNILNPFSLIISAYIIFIEREKDITFQRVFYGAFVAQILIGLLSGMKENTLTPILLVSIVFLFSGGKIPKKIIYTGILLMVFLYPINSAYRTVISIPSLNTGSHTLNMAIALKKVFTEPLLETLSEGSDSYVKRGEMFPFLEYSIGSEEEWHYYKYMTRYLTLPFAWIIPRAVWTDKPRADIGGVFYQQVVGVRTATSITPTSIGWAYFEGGLFFLVVIFIILGIIFEFVDRSDHNKPMIMVFYIILLHKAVKPEWDPYFMLTSLMQFYIMYWFLLKFIGIKKRNITHEN